MRTKVMTDEVITSVMNLIPEGKKIPEIANILGINKVTICNHLKIDITHIHQNDSIPHLSFASKKTLIGSFNAIRIFHFITKESMINSYKE